MWKEGRLKHTDMEPVIGICVYIRIKIKELKHGNFEILGEFGAREARGASSLALAGLRWHLGSLSISFGLKVTSFIEFA